MWIMVIDSGVRLEFGSRLELDERFVQFWSKIRVWVKTIVG